MALDPGILSGPARVEQKKKRGFLLNARHLRRRGTSLCLASQFADVVRDRIHEVGMKPGRELVCPVRGR